MTVHKFQRLPADEYARRYHETTLRLVEELGGGNNLTAPIKPASFNGRLLLLSFLAGGLFWAILIYIVTH